MCDRAKEPCWPGHTEGPTRECIVPFPCERGQRKNNKVSSAEATQGQQGKGNAQLRLGIVEVAMVVENADAAFEPHQTPSVSETIDGEKGILLRTTVSGHTCAGIEYLCPSRTGPFCGPL